MGRKHSDKGGHHLLDDPLYVLPNPPATAVMLAVLADAAELS
jgi:hypothetical protein